MANWDWLNKTIPPMALRPYWLALAATSVIIIALTARRIPVPWQTVPLGAVAAVLFNATLWIPMDVVRTVADLAIVEASIAIGQHLYPAAIRDQSGSWLQLGAVLTLHLVIVSFVLDHAGLKPKRLEHDSIVS